MVSLNVKQAYENQDANVLCPVSVSAVKLRPSNHTIHQTYRYNVLIFMMLHFSVHCNSKHIQYVLQTVTNGVTFY
jgi:hypothetical protein